MAANLCDNGILNCIDWLQEEQGATKKFVMLHNVESDTKR